MEHKTPPVFVLLPLLLPLLLLLHYSVETLPCLTKGKQGRRYATILWLEETDRGRWKGKESPTQGFKSNPHS
ncbi:hypothetical protein BO82DRAFT_352877 [Aspergillus uvarum CBS 121591]|uniref:Secreted protein n=1 Tax=Aspergillus uvarum CBS 121591 TaxID=1448315 RepID=A0A319CE34_9EURO|nr:hypothetical protein BO82DRAFT_352877 [Aspergillus uvarum CBS 121591]PYH83464.1 hypothetical protein BO82DRAFT_352877 [Aspergillus uvarum CBS 121591]